MSDTPNRLRLERERRAALFAALNLVMAAQDEEDREWRDGQRVREAHNSWQREARQHAQRLVEEWAEERGWRRERDHRMQRIVDVCGGRSWNYRKRQEMKLVREADARCRKNHGTVPLEISPWRQVGCAESFTESSYCGPPLPDTLFEEIEDLGLPMLGGLAAWAAQGRRKNRRSA